MEVKTDLSPEAMALLRYRLETKDNRVTPQNKEAYRELARARIMYPVSGFTSGPEYLFRWTDSGWERRFQLLGCAKESA